MTPLPPCPVCGSPAVRRNVSRVADSAEDSRWKHSVVLHHYGCEDDECHLRHPGAHWQRALSESEARGLWLMHVEERTKRAA